MDALFTKARNFVTMQAATTSPAALPAKGVLTKLSDIVVPCCVFVVTFISYMLWRHVWNTKVVTGLVFSTICAAVSMFTASYFTWTNIWSLLGASPQRGSRSATENRVMADLQAVKAELKEVK